MRSRTSRVAVVALAAALLAVCGWWAVYGRTPIAPRDGSETGPLPRGMHPHDLNVLVVTLDTTRWDHLGAYGARQASTPNLDRLAAEGVLFEQATSAVPLTLPAHCTIFTGLLPPEHGVRDNGGYTLDPRHVTLASHLKRAGRATAAFVSAFVLDSRWGLDEGFDRYMDDFDPGRYRGRAPGQITRRGSDVVDAALPWLDAHANEPFFAWVHFYDPHAPYDPPEPFRSSFAGRPYAGEIAYMDRQVGRLLEWLDAKHLSDRTIVVAIGDHGESLQEHAENTHGIFLYDATTRVPFVIRTPYAAMRGRRVSSEVRTEDLVPTVLDLLGERASGAVQGASLVPLMTGARDDLNLEGYSESLYARNHYGWSELRALRSGRFKFIQAPRPELYDLAADPGELHNLYDERQSLARRMDAALQRLAAEPSPRDRTPSAVDPDTRERLAALGYIGSFSSASPSANGALADPKDKIDIFNLMTSAQEADGPDTVITRLKAVLSKDSHVLDAWILLGNEYFMRREYARALEHYRRALAINPDFDLAIVNVAGAYRALGQDEAAIAGFERYLEGDPRNAWVRYQLGEVFLDRGRLDEAERAFREALLDDTRVAAARNALGVIAFKRGDLAAAEREIRQSLAERPDTPRAHFNLALVAEARRDLTTAAAEYRLELAAQPDAYKAAFNLARLYEQIGDGAAQEASYRQSIAINPFFAEGYFFLAKLYVDQGRNLDEAMTLARRGLEVAGRSEFTALGHYVLADALSRLGRPTESAREAAMGRALERKGHALETPEKK